MAWRERHAIQPRSLGWILAGRIPGAALGVLLLKLAGDRALDVLIAGSVLAARLAPGEWRALPGPSTFSLAAARLG